MNLRKIVREALKEQRKAPQKYTWGTKDPKEIDLKDFEEKLGEESGAGGIGAYWDRSRPDDYFLEIVCMPGSSIVPSIRKVLSSLGVKRPTSINKDTASDYEVSW